MRKYCKAYHLKDLRQFPSWSASQQEGEDLTDETIVYLWDDFTVVKSPVLADHRSEKVENAVELVEPIDTFPMEVLFLLSANLRKFHKMAQAS